MDGKSGTKGYGKIYKNKCAMENGKLNGQTIKEKMPRPWKMIGQRGADKRDQVNKASGDGMNCPMSPIPN
jgi:hypothetical protein